MKKLTLLAIVVLVIISCAKKEEAIPGEVGGTLIIGTTDLPSTISPLSPSVFGKNDILDLLFMHLHRIDPETGKMTPELASSWEFSEDLSSITYFLRKDVKWWDGQPVTAEDVYYTYQQMKDPKIKYPNVAALRFIEDVQVLNPYAIRFKFNRVYADILADSDIMPVPKHSYEKLGSDFGKQPVGNGPYKIKKWLPNSVLILTYNEDYYRGRPPLDEIQIRYYPRLEDMVADFVSGGLDLILDIPPTVANDLEKNANFMLGAVPGNTYTYVGWNLNNSHLKDKEIRRALTMAIDRNKILSEVFSSKGKLSLGPLPPSSWGYNAAIEPISYDPKKAGEVLKTKGFEDRNRNKILDKNGKDFTLNIITNIENPIRLQILNRVASDLKNIGINVKSQELDASSFIRAIVEGKFDGYIMGWSVGNKIDPTVYWNSEPSKGRYNFVRYKNSLTDSLIELGVASLNRKKAKEIWNEFQRIIYEDQPYTFLVVPDQISATHKRVKGAQQGIQLASAYTYWIPEAERRVAIAALPKKPAPEIETTPPTTTPSTEKAPTPARVTEPEKSKVIEKRPPKIVEPEKLLEAAAKTETTKVATAPPPVAPPRPSVIKKATPTKQVQPRYPESARTVGAQGKIVVRVIVGTDGKVKAATILRSFGNPACEESAIAAARKWEFEPATKDGVPFEQKVSIPFDFRP